MSARLNGRGRRGGIVETEPELTLDPEETPTPSLHRHPLNLLSLMFGLIFMVLGLAFSVGGIDLSEISESWIWGGTLSALGVVLLAAAIGRHRS